MVILGKGFVPLLQNEKVLAQCHREMLKTYTVPEMWA